MRARVVALRGVVGVVLAAGAVGCGGDQDTGAGGNDRAGGGPPGESTTLVGESDQGLRVRLDPDSEGQVRVRFPATCSRDDRPGEGGWTSLHRHPLVAEVDEDGGFSVDEDYVEDRTDGNEEHVEVHLEGAFGDDGTASGTLELTRRWWDGQSEEFGPPCASGPIGWTTDQPLAEGENLVVALPAVPRTVAPAGDGLVATLDNGDLVRIDPAAGEARRLDGTPVAGPAPTDPGVPATAVAPPAGAAAAGTAPRWHNTPVVVDGGVWTADPATGAVTRFALDSGAATATIDQPIENLAAGAGALWSVSTDIFGNDRHLDKRDPTTGEVLASVPAQDGRIVAGPDDLWYADGTLAGGRLQRVDPATLAFGEPFAIEVPRFAGTELVVGTDRLWWLDVEHLTTVDLTTGRTSDVELPSIPEAVGGGTAGVWTVDVDEAVARRLEGDEVTHTVDIPDGYWQPTITADGTVWLTGDGPHGEHPQALRLDPAVTGA